MKKTNPQLHDEQMYGIYRRKGRLPERHSGSWHVNIQRAGVSYSKVFSDSTYGGMQEALEVARQHRDQLVKGIQPLSRKAKAQFVKSNCRSGVPGVVREDRLVRHKSGIYRITAWRAQIQLAPGKFKQCSFSIKKYGEQAAFELAVQARLRLLEEMDGFVLHTPASKQLQEKLKVLMPPSF